MAARMIKYSGILAAIALLGACNVVERKPEAAPDFRPALDNHLAMVTSRDLEGFKATLTKGDDLNVIFPGGTIIPTTKEVVEFHTDWFKDKDWIMEPEVVKVIEGKDMATALTKYQFRDNKDGKPRSAWLVLVFALEDGEWRLVHDQNTRIDEKPAG